MRKIISLLVLIISVLFVLSACTNQTLTGEVIADKQTDTPEQNSPNTCLVIYDSKIYDITPIIKSGKHKPLDHLCGTDITETFDSGRHAGYSEQKLGKYLVE